MSLNHSAWIVSSTLFNLTLLERTIQSMSVVPSDTEHSLVLMCVLVDQLLIVVTVLHGAGPCLACRFHKSNAHTRRGLVVREQKVNYR